MSEVDNSNLHDTSLDGDEAYSEPDTAGTLEQDSPEPDTTIKALGRVTVGRASFFCSPDKPSARPLFPVQEPKKWFEETN